MLDVRYLCRGEPNTFWGLSMRREESSSHIKPLGFCFHKNFSSSLHFFGMWASETWGTVWCLWTYHPGDDGAAVGGGGEKVGSLCLLPILFTWLFPVRAHKCGINIFLDLGFLHFSVFSMKVLAVTWRRSLRQTPSKPSRYPLQSASNNKGLISSQNWKIRGVVGFRVGLIQQVNRIIQSSVSPSLLSLPFAVLASYQGWLPS